MMGTMFANAPIQPTVVAVQVGKNLFRRGVLNVCTLHAEQLRGDFIFILNTMRQAAAQL